MSNLTKNRRNAAIAVIYAMAQRPQGVTAPEVCAVQNCPIDTATTTMAWMVRSDRLTRVKVKEGRVRARFFADPAVTLESIDAQRAIDHRLAILNRPVGKRGGTKLGTVRADVAKRMAAKHAAKRAAVTVRPARQPLPDIAPKAQATPIITSETKVTICPAPLVDHRYQVPAGETVYGCGFSRMRPGQYPEQATSAAARAVSL